jgi:membrane-bound metal-dependent hydrolase YbcI (DUF457 family)
MATATVPGYRARQATGQQRECCRPKKADEVSTGVTHASTGFILGAGAGLLMSAAAPHGVATADAIGRDLMFGTLVAGFALLPDADHPKASFAFAAGGLSHGLAHMISALFGGHRGGTHSVFGTAAAAAGTAACTLWFPNRWALAGFCLAAAICMAAAFHATGFTRGRLTAFLAAAAVAGAAVALPAVRPDLWWLVALGMALHIIEDEPSGHGCALLWPFTSRRFGGDGRQPAGRRGGRSSQGGRRPRSGYQKAKARATRPVTPKNPARPARSSGEGAISMCLPCMAKDCEACKGQGCKCPQPASSHPGRVTARPRPQDGPPPVPAPEDDIPPF